MGAIFRRWEIAGQPTYSPKEIADAAQVAGYPTHWLSQVNGISFPRGIEYGIGYFLLGTEYAKQLVEDASPIDVVGIELEPSGKSWRETRRLTWKRWWPYKTYLVTPKTSQSNPTNVVQFADVRFHLIKAATTRRFNLRPDDNFVSNTLLNGRPYTWQQVLDALWSDLPPALAGPPPRLPCIRPCSIPENLLFEGVSAFHAIWQVLTMIGYDLVLDPFLNEFRYCKLTNTQAGLLSQKQQLVKDGLHLWDWDPQQMPFASYPHSVKVTYRRGPYDPTLPYVESAIVDADAIADTTWSWQDTTIARGGSTPSNLSQLALRSAEIAEAVRGLARPSKEPFGAVYGGFAQLVPGEQLTNVEWRQDHKYGMRTDARFTRNSRVAIELPLFPRDSAFVSLSREVTTTTTTTTPSPIVNGPCFGSCQWTSTDGVNWIQVSNGCGTTTTTSTTTTTTAPGATTTTTTADPCPCPTTTTTTTTSTPCQCLPPAFCPVEINDCTTTQCATSVGSVTQCTTTTTTNPAITTTTTSTTCDCNTTTTGTTPAPDCAGGCTWYQLPTGEVRLVSNTCASRCPCAPYPGGAGPCQTVSAPCIVPAEIPPPNPIPCSGQCQWLCVGNGAGWHLEQTSCFGTGCGCPPPSQECVCNRRVTTGCVAPPTPTTTTPVGGTTTPRPCGYGTCYPTTTTTTSATTTTSTTTTANPCPGPCRWRWSVVDSQWQLVDSNCGTCGCSSPPTGTGSGNCDLRTTGCARPTTTTTTTTTTTARGSCCVSTSCVEGVNAEWCASAGGTYLGNGARCIPANRCAPTTTTSAPTTTTTTTGPGTTTTTTTTTPGPVGNCCKDGVCFSLTAADCAAIGGIWSSAGFEPPCFYNPCPNVGTTTTTTAGGGTTTTVAPESP